MSAHRPQEKDFDVVVVQGTLQKTWLIRAPNKAGAINQANRILKIQRVKPAKVLAATEKKP